MSTEARQVLHGVMLNGVVPLEETGLLLFADFPCETS